MSSLCKPVDAAVCFAQRSSSAVLLDRLQRRRALTGERFLADLGQLSGRSIVVLRPDDGFKWDACLSAAARGHCPALIIGAGWSSANPNGLAPGSTMMANRVVTADGSEIQLGVPFASPSGVALGAVGPYQAGSNEGPLLGYNSWCLPFAEWCQERGQPAAIVSLIHDQQANEATKPSLSWRAGAWLAKLWKNPSSVKSDAQQTLLQWQRQADLADAIEQVLSER